ncbi:Pnap_2097 family protein [Ancylobacter pratisalsi]|uniref:Biosynthetic protein, Pnap_2097 family n=1 Tax=Ancylobacter pratisalsi TaxID=1745854 RepID=A0A6P1YLJ0_9HYPH|nr:Pnap_2097 family protein [Ancylobacter pratisalsi]QIB34228.1 hypothetical protein G3A50_11300 [Ancylobacter pratisalsi]
MNLAVPPGGLGNALAIGAGTGSLFEDTAQLGMPQLCLGGLSEAWLLKELGHRHWMLLARLAGHAAPDFRDVDGAPVYAAFCALSIRDAAFGVLGENDRLTLHSDLMRVSRTQFLSRHRLTAKGRAMGTVELVSTFIRRSATGNHAVARVAIETLPPPLASPAAGLAGLAADMRAERMDTYKDFDLRRRTTTEAVEIEPCPAQDFNGAGFLYFPSFIAFVDRAEWQFETCRAPRATTIHRDVFFYGNVDPGEKVRVSRHDTRRGEGRLAHHCRLERASDGVRLADAFTLRRV